MTVRDTVASHENNTWSICGDFQYLTLQKGFFILGTMQLYIIAILWEYTTCMGTSLSENISLRGQDHDLIFPTRDLKNTGYIFERTVYAQILSCKQNN